VFTYHPEHHHTHFDDFAVYRLRRITKGGETGLVVRTGSKVSFCLTDSDIFNAELSGFSATGQYLNCDGKLQGISVGWADVYDQFLPNQWIDVTGVKAGKYLLEVSADPDHHLVESNIANNTTRIVVGIPGKNGPRNDNFGKAIVLSRQQANVSGNNRGAGIQKGEPKIGGAPGGVSVWWSWRAPANGIVTISTSGSRFDTLLGVYTGKVVDSLKLIASNDDAGDGDLTSRVVFRANAGTMYRIAVDGYQAATGAVRLGISEAG
jgi:hypothetical protein